MTEPDEPFFLWTLFQQLRRRGFALGPEEYEAVRLALRAGFGWSSRREFREVCSALWAKSREERAVVAALFDQRAADYAGLFRRPIMIILCWPACGGLAPGSGAEVRRTG